MSDARTNQRLLSPRVYLLVGAVSTLAVLMVLLSEWQVPTASPSRFWNALAAFALLSIVSDALFFRIPIANSNASLAFIPLQATVLLLVTLGRWSLAGSLH